MVAIFVCNETLSCLPPVILNLPLQGIDCFIYVIDIHILCITGDHRIFSFTTDSNSSYTCTGM